MFKFRKGPKRASKVQEARLVKTAKWIADDPTRVIPECRGKCFLCKFGKSKKYIEKIASKKGDSKYLLKASKRGSDLSRAVAGTILLADKDKLPVLATAKTSQGDINYVKGSAKEKYMMGIQHFHDPIIRLFAYHSEAKRGYFLYSWGNEIVCTGKEDDPPKDYFDSRISGLPYNFRKDGNTYSCGHTYSGSSHTHISLIWKSIGNTIKVCSRCARPDVNLFVHLTEGMLSKDNTDHFSLRGSYKLECRGKCERCVLDSLKTIPSGLKENYYKGEISDRKLIKGYDKHARNRLKKKKDLYVIGKTCYGQDINSFFEAFDYEDWEKVPLKKAIYKSDNALVLEQASINELLNNIWEKKGKKIVHSIVEDKDMTEEIYTMSEEKKFLPREVLKEAYKTKETMTRLNALPKFKRLPPKAKFAHELAVVYKTDGAIETVNHIDNLDTADTRLKALAFGFLVALDKGDSRRWRYNTSEVDVGEFLKDYVIKLLDSEGDDYAKALQELLKMSGSTARIVLNDGTELR